MVDVDVNITPKREAIILKKSIIKNQSQFVNIRNQI